MSRGMRQSYSTPTRRHRPAGDLVAVAVDSVDEETAAGSDESAADTVGGPATEEAVTELDDSAPADEPPASLAEPVRSIPAGKTPRKSLGKKKR